MHKAKIQCRLCMLEAQLIQQIRIPQTHVFGASARPSYTSKATFTNMINVSNNQSIRAMSHESEKRRISPNHVSSSSIPPGLKRKHLTNGNKNGPHVYEICRRVVVLINGTITSSQFLTIHLPSSLFRTIRRMKYNWEFIQVTCLPGIRPNISKIWLIMILITIPMQMTSKLVGKFQTQNKRYGDQLRIMEHRLHL